MKTPNGDSQTKRSSRRQKSHTIIASDTSKKYLIRRFNQDFYTSVKKQGVVSGHINYFTANEILIDMGFLAINGIETNEERILFVDLWRSMKGDESDGVTDKNLKIMLGAIEGFMFDTQQPNKLNVLHMEVAERVSATRGTPSTSKQNARSSASKSKNRNKKYHASLSDLEFDEDGVIQLTRFDIKKIQRYFFIFARNRSSFLSVKNHKKQTEELERETSISHKPHIDMKSRKLIKDLHEKLGENQIPHYEFLLFKGREYDRKAQESKHNLDFRINSQCTFFPDTSVTSSFYQTAKHQKPPISASASRLSP